MHRAGSLRVMLPDMGTILLFLGMVSAAPLVVALWYREISVLPAMATAPALFLALGLYCARMPREDRESPLSAAIGAVALIWLVAAFIGAIPFTIALGMPFTDSVFEAMSGWTSTGLTLVPSVDAAPHAILFWRTLMQWVGGLGIVAFTIALSQRSGLVQRGLYRSEGRSEAFMPGVTGTAASMWKIYIAITALGTALILCSGIPVWDALNIAMASIATGGFSVHSEGILYYHNPLLEMLVIPVMIAGALPFKLFYLLYARKEAAFLRDPQARLLFGLIAVGFFVVAWDLVFREHLLTGEALRQSIFMVTSAITCTGFQNGNPFEWTGATVLFFSALMLVGGATGSTAGGIKLNRLLLGLESLSWWFHRLFVSGKVVVPFRHDGKVIPKNIAEIEVSKNMLIIILFILTVFFASLAVMHLEGVTRFESSDVIFEVASAMCNVGISTGYVNPGLSLPSKWLFIFVMWFGRLEIVPVIVLIMEAAKGFR
ncbi:MAG: TrkH family potassium uptake protein [Methanomicrobiales archaeon]|nr:TrkH family potassium uptake protein [Methanomicrobiales archaeon]